MNRIAKSRARWLITLLLCLSVYACKDKESKSGLKDLPDLNEQMRVYVTTARTKVRTGPGPQFRPIADIGPDARVNVVGRDGDWVLIVSKKGNAPGYIEMASVEPSSGSTEESKETLNPRAEGKYVAATDTQVRSGPGLHYPVIADISKGTKLNVVDENNGWLKVESKQGNKPGYVDASLAKPATGD
ncbi:MAG: SH3 domain-containing protein [Chloroflexota bacterium]